MIRRLIVYSFAALFFFTPLLLWPTTFELFEFNKMMFVYLMAGLISGLWMVRCITEKKFIITRTPLDLALLLFFLSQLLSTIFSINTHTSLWGYYSRFHGGLISTVSYILLYYAFVANVTKKDLAIIINFLLASSTIVTLYGIAEHLGIDKDLWVQDVQSRVFSTLGQPNWLSAYLVALLPLPIYLALNSKNWKSSAVYYLLSTSYFVSILFTKSRSGIGAMGIILGLIFLHQLVTKRLTKKFVICNLVFVICALTLGTPWTPNPQSINRNITVGGPIWPEIEPLLNRVHLTTQIKPIETSKLSKSDLELIDARSKGVTYGGSDSGEIRNVVWQGAISLFKKHPILGTGVETFGYSYYWTRPAAHNLLSEWDFLYNKAHNEYLNFLATTGGLGLATYIFLSGSILFLLFKKHAALTIGFISILITNYFGFSVVIIGIFFFLFPALSITSSIESPPAKGEKLSKKSGQRAYSIGFTSEQYVGYIIIAIILSAWWWMIIAHWSADIKFTRGKQLHDAGYVGQALPDLESAVSLYPDEPTFRGVLAESYASAALAVQQQYSTLPKDQQATSKANFLALRNGYMQKATDQITKVISDNPWHLNFLKSKAKIELTLAQIDPSFNQNALDTLMRANELAPTDAKVLYNIGLIQLELNQKEPAKTAFAKAIELKRDYNQAQIQLDNLSK